MQGKESGLKCVKCLKKKKKIPPNYNSVSWETILQRQGKNKDFPEKEKLMKSVGSRSALQEKLKKKNTSNGIKIILF